MHYNQSSNLIYKIACKLLRRGTPETPKCESDLEDRSYEDALLDGQLSSFFRAEYSKVEPPRGIFPRVVQAIRLHNEKQQKLARASTSSRIRWSLGEKVAMSYRFLARADTGRVLSGGMVTVLLLMVVGPGLLHSLPGDNMSNVYSTYFDVFSSNSNSGANEYPTNTTRQGYPEDFTDQTSTNATRIDNTGAVTNSAGKFISPGRLYEDPTLWLSTKTGENATDLGNKGSASSSQTIQLPTEPQYERPILGQY